MSYTEKIDVLDMIIKILQEHEKKFDELVYRLELLVEQIDERKMPDIDLVFDLLEIPAIEDLE